MSEFLKVDKNGQWSLQKNWKKPQIDAMERWADSGMREHLKKLPAAKGKLREEMLTHLNKESKSRIHPKTGEKEYQVHRAANLSDNSHNDRITSWTTDPSFAHYWSLHTGEEEAPKVMSAWVPEKHIHSYLPYLQQKHGHEKNEGEMLVHPHDVNVERTLTGKALEREDKKYGIEKEPVSKYHFDNTAYGGKLKLTKEQSAAMHGKPHPTEPGVVWNHGKVSETGYTDIKRK